MKYKYSNLAEKMSKILSQKIRNLPSKVCWLSFSKGCVETWLGTWSLEGRRSLSYYYYSALWRKSVHAWPGLCPLWHCGSKSPKPAKNKWFHEFFQVSANSHNLHFVQYCCRHEYDLSISRIFWISFLAGFWHLVQLCVVAMLLQTAFAIAFAPVFGLQTCVLTRTCPVPVQCPIFTFYHVFFLE